MTRALPGDPAGARALRPRRLRRTTDGPDEPLAWFATVHRLPLDDFLRDVREAAVKDAAAAPPDPAKTPSLFSPHFVVGSLFLTLTLGATTGMINLLRIAAGGDVPIDHRQIHGHTQVLGFAALFLMGIAYHALPADPRRRRPSPRPHRARSSFWLMFVGVAAAQRRPAFRPPPCGPARSRSSRAAMELASGLLFVRFVFALLARVRGRQVRPQGPAPPLRAARAPSVSWPRSLLGAAQGLWLAGNIDTVLPAALNESFYFVALYGFLLAWIYGFGHRHRVALPRRGPGRRAARPKPPWRRRWPASALAARVLGPGRSGRRRARPARRGARAGRALGARLSSRGNGFLWRRSDLPMLRTPGNPDRRHPRRLRVPRPLGGARARGRPPHAHDAACRPRTSGGPTPRGTCFTIGFLTLLIVGMSFRILPVFSGKDPLVAAIGPRDLRPAPARRGDAPAPVPGGLPAGLLPDRLVHGNPRRARARALPLQPRAHDARASRAGDAPAAAARARRASSRRFRCDNPRVPPRPPIPFNAIPILAPLTAEDRAALDAALRARAYEKGDDHLRGGRARRSPSISSSSAASRSSRPPPTATSSSRSSGPASPSGAVAVFEQRPFPASAIALEPSGTVSIPEREFFQPRREAARDHAPPARGPDAAADGLEPPPRRHDGLGRVSRGAPLLDSRRAGRPEASGRDLRPDPPLAPGDRRPRRDDDRDGDPGHEPLAEGRHRRYGEGRVPDPADRRPARLAPAE